MSNFYMNSATQNPGSKNDTILGISLLNGNADLYIILIGYSIHML